MHMSYPNNFGKCAHKTCNLRQKGNLHALGPHVFIRGIFLNALMAHLSFHLKPNLSNTLAAGNNITLTYPHQCTQMADRRGETWVTQNAITLTAAGEKNVGRKKDILTIFPTKKLL